MCAWRLGLTLTVISGLVGGDAARGQEVPRPDSPGPYPVGYQQWDAHTRGYEGLDLWYPAEPTGQEPLAGYSSQARGSDWGSFSIPALIALDAPPVAQSGLFPLVVYSHGYGATSFNQSTTCEVLASHGFVVAAIQHPYRIDEVGNTRNVKEVIDLFAQLSSDPASPFFEHIMADHVGVSGISLGARVAVLASSGSPTSRLDPDPRVRAIAPIEGAPSVSYPPPTVPALVIGSGPDLVTALDGLPRYRVLVNRYAHGSSADICAPWEYVQRLENVPESVLSYYSNSAPFACSPANIDNEQAIRLTTLYSVAFFKTYLGDDNRYHPYLTQDYAQTNEEDVRSFFVVGARAGDITGDGVFNSKDTRFLVRGAKYATGMNADWAEGDFNGDGVFDRLDLVKALAETGFSTKTVAAISAPAAAPGDSADAVKRKYSDLALRQVTVVPEPSTLLLGVTGLAILFKAIRQQRSLSRRT